MKNDDSNGDLIFAMPIVLVGIALLIWRRAHTISSQFGYEMWSYEMWAKLRFQLLASLVLLVVVGMIRWVWRKSRSR